MTVAPASLMSIHAIHGDAAPLWLPSRVAFRVVTDPRLGFPIGPFAVRVTGLGELPAPVAVGYDATGPGWRGGGVVDGEAWLALRLSGPTTGAGRVVLSGAIPDGTEVAIVRGPADTQHGIAVRRRGPWILSAPRVRYIRVRGSCKLDPDVWVTLPLLDLGGDITAMGLPLGVMADDPTYPAYLGRDGGESVAWKRVEDAAPGAFAPHERPLEPGDPARPVPSPGDEVDRVGALVKGWLRDTLRERIAQAINDRPIAVALPALSATPPLPTAGTGDLDALHAVMLTAADPGIARWLGYGMVDAAGVKNTIYAVTVAGRWALPKGRLAILGPMFDDAAVAGSMLSAAGLADQLDPGIYQGYSTTSLWAQAIVDPSAPPDPPGPPSVGSDAPAFWTAGAAGDAVELALAIGDAVPLGQIALQRVDGAGAVDLMPEIQGVPGRRRPLFATEGADVRDRIETPGNGSVDYRSWQADVFGRWSGQGLASVPEPARPGMPQPLPTIQVLPVSALPPPPTPFSASVRVTVPIPQRIAGQPAVAKVSAVFEGPPVWLDPTSPTEMVYDALPAPPTTPATQIKATLSVMFRGSEGSIGPAKDTAITFTDPRPPAPPVIPSILQFTERPDATGVATFRLIPPADPTVRAWELYGTSETRLRRGGMPAPSPTLGRDDRAKQWVTDVDRMTRDLFDMVATVTVGTDDGFRPSLPGDLAEIVFYRLVPIGPGGGSPMFEACPVIPAAVPRSISPARPLLSLDTTAEPPVATITSLPGRVRAVGYRLRMADGAGDDVRAAKIISHGDLGADGMAVMPLPNLLPFSRVVLVAEVLGEEEPGAPPAPGMWSRPSLPVDLLFVPKVPPQLIDNAAGTRANGTLTVSVTLHGMPAHPAPSAFALRLSRRDAPGIAPSVVGDFAIDQVPSAADVAGATWAVALVDPFGRVAKSVDVA